MREVFASSFFHAAVGNIVPSMSGEAVPFLSQIAEKIIIIMDRYSWNLRDYFYFNRTLLAGVCN